MRRRQSSLVISVVEGGGGGVESEMSDMVAVVVLGRSEMGSRGLGELR